jgi:hypothetical protein
MMFLIATALICRCLNPVDTLRLSLDTPPLPIDIVLVSSSNFIAANCLDKEHKNFFLFQTFPIKSNRFDLISALFVVDLSSATTSTFFLQAFGGELRLFIT